jgi:hypothetical protein
MTSLLEPNDGLDRADHESNIGFTRVKKSRCVVKPPMSVPDANPQFKFTPFYTIVEDGLG